MISGFHITASLQPPTVKLNADEVGITPGQADTDNKILLHTSIRPYEELIRALSLRVEKLEAEVFKDENSVKVPAIKDSEPEPQDIPRGSVIADVMSSTKWASVFDEVGKRLDSCAGQASVSECIASMRSLKRDLATLAESFGERTMTKEQTELCCQFLRSQTATIPNIKGANEVVVKYPRKEEPMWRTQAPPQKYASVPRSSFSKASGEGGKKWGPCFYCACPEWKPGHSCEGSRAAEQRRREKEARASQ